MANLKKFAALAAVFSFTLISQLAFASTQEKEWTMLVYINGHNNLDYYGKLDINEMEQVGSTDEINVVVQWASLAATTTKRLYIQKDNDKFKVSSPVVQDLPRVDMGDYRQLVDFIKWGSRAYPAKHYFVVVWNHGTGWHKFQLDGGFHTWDISIDDVSKNAITTTQLGLAMEDASKVIGRKIDIYASDACLMGMMEVAHQMKDSVQYFIGSEDLEPGEGWPYHTILEKWASRRSDSPEEVAKFIPKLYADEYKDAVTLSTYNLDHIDPLATALSNLRATMSKNSNAKKELSAAVQGSLKFAKLDYVDLGDFLEKLKSRKVSGAIKQAIATAQSELDNLVIANAATGKFKQAQGLAIWFPNSAFDYTKWQKKYSELSFDIVSQWHLLIEESL